MNGIRMKSIACDVVAGPCTGHLVIVGGRENRMHDMVILDRFVTLAGGPDARIFVLTAASTMHDEM